MGGTNVGGDKIKSTEFTVLVENRLIVVYLNRCYCFHSSLLISYFPGKDFPSASSGKFMRALSALADSTTSPVIKHDWYGIHVGTPS